MKTKQELLEMLFSKLAELQDINKQPLNNNTVVQTSQLAQRLQIEVVLLYDILGDDVPMILYPTIRRILGEIEEEI